MDTGLDKLYAEFGNLFADSFGVDDPAALATINAAGHQLAAHFTLVDHLVDGDVDRRIGATEATRRVIGGFRDLTDVVGDREFFWSWFDPAVSRWLEAFEVEADYRDGRPGAPSFGMTQMSQLAADRGCVAVGTPALLASRSLAADRAERLDAVARSIDAYSIAQQLRDDVVDWRLDLQHRRPNFVLVALSDLVDIESAPAEELARVLHRDRVALGLLRDAITRTAQAQALVEEVAPAWSGVMAQSGARLREALEYIETMGPPPRDTRGSVRLTVALDPDLLGGERVVDGLRVLLQHWQRGRSLRHVMVFPRDSGVSRPGVYVGDVFARAMALNCLAGIGEASDGAFDGLLQIEADRLESRRDTTGDTLWRYFPGLEDLSPDLDTFAEVGAALLASDRMTGELRATYLSVADRALGRARGTGALETWFYGDAVEARAVEVAAASTLWGRTEDPDVAANFLWFLLQLDPHRFRPAVESLVDQIFGELGPGPVRSTWYTDCGYAEYVTARLLVACDATRRRSALVTLGQRSEELLRSVQDAGMRHYRSAFFLLTRDLLLREGIALDVDPDLVQDAVEWLAERCASPSLPAEEPFIHMDLGRTGRLSGELFFSSEILQRAFGLLALTRAATWSPGADRIRATEVAVP